MTNYIKDNLLSTLMIIIMIIECTLIMYIEKNVYITDFMNSDTAGDVIFAKFLADSGCWIFSDNWYPTTELYVVHHQLIMTPLFHLVDDYNTVIMITAFISIIMISGVLYFSSKCLGGGIREALFSICFFLSPVGMLPLFMLVYFNGYLFFFVMALVLLAIYLGMIRNTISVNDKKYILLLLFVSFISGLCGIRMAMVIYVPLIIAFFLSLSIDRKFLIIKEKITMSCLFFALGFIIYFCYLGPTYGNGSAVSDTQIQDLDNIVKNLTSVKSLFLSFIGIESFEKYSIINIIYWLIPVYITVALAIRKRYDILIFSFSTLFFTLFLMIVTIPNEIFLSSNRYLVLAICPLYISLISYVLEIKNSVISIKYMTSILFIFVIASILFCMNQSNETRTNLGLLDNKSRQGYIEFLINNNLKYGYSKYWNANITTFMSNDLIKMCPVIDVFNLEMYKWNTVKSYEYERPQFILLTIDEYETRKKEKSDDNILYHDEYVYILQYN